MKIYQTEQEHVLIILKKLPISGDVIKELRLPEIRELRWLLFGDKQTLVL